MMFRNQVGIDERDDAIPTYRYDYLTLVDETGRIVRSDKRGSIPSSLSPILDRIGYDPESWRLAMREFTLHRNRVLRPPDLAREYVANIGQSWVQGLNGAS